MAKASIASIMATTLVGLLLWGAVPAKAEENKCGAMSEVMASLISWEVAFAKSGFYPSEYHIEKFKNEASQFEKPVPAPGLSEAQIQAGLMLRLCDYYQDPEWIAFAIQEELQSLRQVMKIDNPVAPLRLHIVSEYSARIRAYLQMFLVASSYEDAPEIGDQFISFDKATEVIEQKMACLG